MNELRKDLQNLKDFWELQSRKQEPEYYNDCGSIDQFTEDLDIIIKKYQEIYSDTEQFQK